MTMAQMALGFILREPRVSTIIPGMRRPAHVSSNLSVSDAESLDADLMKQLEKHRWDREPTKWSQ
jgi:aryl-alcohol dehydrogenase-like predicted oxidoreductase